MVDSVGPAGLPRCWSAHVRRLGHGGCRVNWVRVTGVIYDKFDGEFASRLLTYASTGTVRYQW